MIIKKDGIIAPDGTHYQIENYSVRYFGFLYVLGISAGKESIVAVLNLLEEGRDIQSTSVFLKGQYFICIENIASGKRYFFTDESGNYHAFYSSSYISNSFIELSKLLKLNVSDFNPTAVAEFIHWGNFHYDRTFFDSIKKIKGNQIFNYENGEELQVLEKADCHVSIPNPTFSFPDFFKLFCESVKNEKIVVDITGGVDSRLIVSTLHFHNIEFDLAISGVEGNDDIRIAKIIADTLNKKLHILYHTVDNIQYELEEIFSINECLSDVVGYHRAYQLALIRKQNNYSLSISGAGGEIYKDFPWMQDFPFFNKKHSNFNRYYNFRFCPIEPIHSVLAGRFYDASKGFKSFVIQEWKEIFLQSTNSQSYDNIYSNYKWPAFAGRYITSTSKMVSCYAPLLELDLAKFTFALPRGKRLFNQLHRRWISYYSQSLSRIETTEGGMSVSNKYSVLLSDGMKFLINRFRRLINKISQKLFKKSYLPYHNPNNLNLFVSVRKLPMYVAAVEQLKKEGILYPKIKPAQLKDRYVGSVLAVSRLIDELK